jgi:hypothetical protein
VLLAKVARRISDDEVLHLLKIILKANGKRGVPQGGVISPTISNLYLNEVDFRRVRNLAGRWRAQYAPKMKKRTALLQKLREIFRRYRSQPVQWVVEHINPILRGWVNYFAIGYSSRCFQFVKRWVEVKVRRHLMRARKRRGLGWERWTTQWMRGNLGLFNGYRLRRDLRKVVSVA